MLHGVCEDGEVRRSFDSFAPAMSSLGHRIEDWSETLTLSETSSIGSYDDVVLDFITLKKRKRFLALLAVCDWELSEARKKDPPDRARVRGEEPPDKLLAEKRGSHSSVEADVTNLLEGKTYSQLETFKSEIESQMHPGTAKHVEYWVAKACLKEILAKMLHKHLQHPEGREDSEENLNMPDDLQPEEESKPDANGVETYSPERVEEEIHVAEEASSFSRELLHGDENEATDPEEDRAILEHKCMAVLEHQRRIKEAMTSKPAPSPEDIEMKAAMKAMGDMEEGDALFGSSSEVTDLDS
ncbi:hypothetical protein ACLB2K_063740 [Fragaria x ananassa]